MHKKNSDDDAKELAKMSDKVLNTTHGKGRVEEPISFQSKVHGHNAQYSMVKCERKLLEYCNNA